MLDHEDHVSEQSPAAEPPAPKTPVVDEQAAASQPDVETLGPVSVTLRVERGDVADPPRLVMAGLTAEALWIQDVWPTRRIALRDVAGVEVQRPGWELGVSVRTEVGEEKVRLAFADSKSRQRWAAELEARRLKIGPDAPASAVHVPEGVSLVEVMPDVPHVVVGKVDFTDRSARSAERGLQLRAALLGADAITDVYRGKVADSGEGTCRVAGWAIRLEDPSVGARLRRQCYTEQVGTLVRRMLVLLMLQAAYIAAAGFFCASVSPLNVMVVETPTQLLLSVGMGLGIVCGWPLVMVLVSRVLRWPFLLRTTGLVVLAVTSGRVLTVWLAYFLAVRASNGHVGLLSFIDPFDWSFIIAGVLLCQRAWHLADDARYFLAAEGQVDSTPRKVIQRGLLGVTVVYAGALLIFVGVSRYQSDAYQLQPGVDLKREQEALRAYNEGVAQAERDDLTSAERSWQRALRVWEDLTAGKSSPTNYRVNLAQTLYNLGWVNDRREHHEEAERYYKRALEVGEKLVNDPAADEQFRRLMAEARQVLNQMRDDKMFKGLEEKDRIASRKYEEAEVKSEHGAQAEAEGLFGEAVALWEEIVPQAISPEYRKAALRRFAIVYLRLGEVRQQLRKPKDAEAALRKSIDYGEKALAAEPDRPLVKHNLEVARQRLDQLLEDAHLEEIEKLFAAERYADGIDLCIKGIEQLEEALRSGKDRESAARRLALRLERFARFLAHCPDPRVRNTKAAVKRASRATELQPDVGDYWYTLALVQYRNGDWRDSLTSLERVKARDGQFGGSDWLLVAMNRHQLKQKDEARAAFRKAVEWMEEQQRKAEENAVLRFQYEMMRPALESLRREAEKLIEGKDPNTRGVG
jgi:tetratricopeptide (TPR) repeat protein